MIWRTMAVLCSLFLLSANGWAAHVQHDFNDDDGRYWVSPSFWGNRPIDWQVAQGRLWCRTPEGTATQVLIDTELHSAGGFEVRWTMGSTGPWKQADRKAWQGVLLTQQRTDDFRPAAIFPEQHQALRAGINAAGYLFIQRGEKTQQAKGKIALDQTHRMALKVDQTAVRLQALDEKGAVVSEVGVDGLKDFVGHVCLAGSVKKFDRKGFLLAPPTSPVQLWFDALSVQGDGVVQKLERQVGPVFFAMYTIHRGTLRLTAQCVPMSPKRTYEAVLEIKTGDQWQEKQRVKVQPLSWIASFELADWPDQKTYAYRVRLVLDQASELQPAQWLTGTIRPDPKDQETLVVAGMSCNDLKPDRFASRTTFVNNVIKQSPDLLIFAGDQFYQNQPTRAMATPAGATVEQAMLDYLYKWFCWGWSHQKMLATAPSIFLMDDHDLFMGNIWGEGGKQVELAKNMATTQDSGGYLMSIDWVNLAESVQYGHMPPSFHQQPGRNGLLSRYTSINVGGVDIAVLEDRKYKSAPKIVMPTLAGRNGSILGQPTLDEIDPPAAKLLGDGQEAFLKAWVQDWRDVQMKMAVSSTLLACLQTTEGGALIADMDANGWPRSGRNRAVDLLRRGSVFMLSGDQHLGSIVHHGIDDFRDAGIAFCLPSVTNTVFERRWKPTAPPIKPDPAGLRYGGDYVDLFGNKVSVMALANPISEEKRSHGYGIIRFNKKDQTITAECWPRDQDPQTAKQIPSGWPKTFAQSAMDGRRPVAYLPKIEITGIKNPVVRVYHAKDGALVYARRIVGQSYQPPVFKAGAYHIEVGSGEVGAYRRFEKVSSAMPNDQLLRCDF